MTRILNILSAIIVLHPVINSTNACCQEMKLAKPTQKSTLLQNELLKMPTLSDFKKILSHTYENNPELAASVYDQKATAESVPKALSGWRPNIEVSSSKTGSKDHSKRTFSGSPSRTRTDTSQAKVTYNIFEGGKTTSSTAAAEASVRAGFAQFDAREQQTLFEAAQAYFQLLKAKDEIRVNKSQEDRLQKQLKFVKAQADVGEKSRTDLEEARSDYIKSVNRRIVAEQNFQVRKAAFIQIVQAYPDTEHMALPSLPLALFPNSSEEAGQLAMTQNPSVLQAKETVTSREESIGVARSSLLPRVDLSASAAKTNSSTRSSTRHQYQGSVELTVPILSNGGANWAELRKTTQEKNKSRKDLLAQRLKAAKEASESWAQWDYTKRQIPYLEKQVQSTQILVDGRRQEYEAGEKILLSVTEAEDKLIQAEIALLNARQDERIQACKLLTSIGRFSAQNLALPVNRYNIKQHYQETRSKWIGNVDNND